MYAIIEDRGRQYRVAPGQRLVLDRAAAEPGSTIEAPVLFVCDGDSVEVGAPRLDGRKAVLKVLRHQRGPKVIAGTFRRRKDSRRRVGGRHEQTAVEVVEIG
ncbi:MAG: 50S ribosomal protein L21 [Planctomycetota bacterium]